MNIFTVPAHQLLTVDPVDDTADGAAPGADGSSDMRGVVVMGLTGDLDLHSGPDLRWALKDLLSPPTRGHQGGGSDARSMPAPVAGDWLFPVRAVIVDLTEVEFIDSYAVGVLVQGHHLARRSGRAYAVVATHPMIHTLFAVTGLAKVMPLHPDVTSAVASLWSTTPPGAV